MRVLILLCFFCAAPAFGSKLKVEKRGNFVRIEDQQRGQPYVLYLNCHAVLSVSMAKIDRSFTVDIVTKELVASGNAAVNKVYTFSFFSEAEATLLMEYIAGVAGGR